MTLLERDLNELAVRLQGQLTFKLDASMLTLTTNLLNQIYLSAARVNLFALYFFEPIGTDCRKQGLLKAFAAACEYIEAFAAADTPNESLSYMPVFVYYQLSLAGFLLLKILNSSYAQYLDSQAGKRLFNSAVIGLRNLFSRSLSLASPVD
jgi:hypothetical protein